MGDSFVKGSIGGGQNPGSDRLKTARPEQEDLSVCLLPLVKTEGINHPALKTAD